MIREEKKLIIKKNFKYFGFLILFFFFSFLFIKPVLAVSFYFEPESKNVARGEVFLEKILIDTEGEEINALEVEIEYPKEKLKVENISNGNSILKIWPAEPKAKDGKINFIGGAPGGYKGKDGILILVAFQVISREKADLIVKVSDKSRAFLNDGKGSEAEKVSFGFSKIKVFNNVSEKNEWEEFLKKDKNPPEPFEIKLSRSPHIFDNKYFISFFAFDRESGIDYYKIAEVKKGKGINKEEAIKRANWKIAKSPYLLEDQNLKSYILVKAVDKAGNERIEILEPKENNYLLIISFVFLSILLVVAVIKKLKI